jgi:cytochrome c55X
MKKLVFVLLALFASSSFAAEPSAEKQAEIRTMLKNTCSSCHGVDLKGAIGPALKPETLGSKSDELLIDTIYNGRKGTMMSSWKASMNKDEIAWLVGILKSGK